MLRLTKKGLGNYLKKFKNEIFGQTIASELSFISENIALFLNHEITEVILSYNNGDTTTETVKWKYVYKTVNINHRKLYSLFSKEPMNQ